jgi:hypothetical protein
MGWGGWFGKLKRLVPTKQSGAHTRRVPVSVLLQVLNEDQRNGRVLGGGQERKEVVVLKYESDLPQPKVSKLVGIQTPTEIPNLASDVFRWVLRFAGP